MRPLGVTLIGIYQILRGALGVLFGLSLMLFTGLAAKLASLAAEGNAAGRVLHSFGSLAGMLCQEIEAPLWRGVPRCVEQIGLAPLNAP